jgi:hypothetical protein
MPRGLSHEYNPLAPEQRQLAWQTAYLFALDLHPDAEIAWEASQWRQLGAPGIAELCEDLLRQRRADDFSIPAETTPDALTALWQRVPRAEVFRLVRSGGVCLLAAIRLAYWLNLTAEEIAA